MTAAWSLVTVNSSGPTACLEVGGELYRLMPSLQRVGMGGAANVADLFSDWGRSRAALEKAAEQVQSQDRIGSHAGFLAPLLYPGKVLCAGANYYDHLEEMGVPDTQQGGAAAVLLLQAAAQCGGRRGRHRAHADRHRGLRLGESNSPP